MKKIILLSTIIVFLLGCVHLTPYEKCVIQCVETQPIRYIYGEKVATNACIYMCAN